MWQMGRCPLSSIQCEFRHADPPGSNTRPVLQEAFTPRPRASDLNWSFGNHGVHRDRQPLLEGFAPRLSRSPDDFGRSAIHADRQPLQEIVLPASLTEVHGLDRVHEEADQSTWGSPRSSPQRWATGEMQPSAFGKLSLLTDPQPIGERVLTSNRTSTITECWISEQRARYPEGCARDSRRYVPIMARTYWMTSSDLSVDSSPEHNITIWEDQEEFQEQDAAGSAPMSESDSEDGMPTSPTLVDLQCC
jgi:hypothetical protein